MIKKNSLLVTYLAFSLFCTSRSFSQNYFDIQLNDTITEHGFVMSELHAYVDSTNQLKFKEIYNHFADKFAVNPDYTKNDFDVNSTYWVRLNIRHSSNSNRQWLLEFFDQTIDSITMYKPMPDKSFQARQMGDQLPFNLRELEHKNFLFVLNNSQDSVVQYYFKINSANRADIRIVLRSLNHFVYYALNEYFIFGIFYGLIFIICIYNIQLFLAIRERKYIVYTFYLLSVGIYAMCTDGIAFQYLWPQSPKINQLASGISIYLIILFALLFTQLFLQTQKRSPHLNKLLRLTIFIRSLIFIYALFFSKMMFDNRFIEIIPISIMLITSIRVKLSGYRPARFMVIAYSILMLGIIIKSLVYAGFFPFSIISNYSLRIGFILEMLFLTIALGDRVKTLKENRDNALLETIREHEINVQLLDKVNVELEAKVMDRTIELNLRNELLEESNHKLLSQAQEIHQINTVLDLDNWKLKNNLRQVVEDRLFNKYLTYDEFRSVFTDNLACYRYLDKNKWGKGFTCRKCNNHKYSSNHTSFSRRCSRCGYVESVTAFTIFHGIKFPIEKAFYITFRVARGKKDFTLEELAKTLSLRTNTTRKFKLKVEQMLDKQPKIKNKYRFLDIFPVALD